MFRKKKLYKIVYELFSRYTTIIDAKDEYQALKKFKREVKNAGIRPTIISFEEIQV
jgi:hypothetical protein